MASRATAYKAISSDEYRITPFRAYAPHSYTYVSGSINNSVDVQLLFGNKYTTDSGLRVENSKQELYDSILQSFYSPIPYASYGINKNSYKPDGSVYVISVTQDIFGETIIPGTFSLQVGSDYLVDDSRGNLIVSSSGTGSVVGGIFYDKGIAVIRPKSSPNINPDPLWANGISNDGTGWEFLIATASTDTLGPSQGIFEPYPGVPTVAAKIGTRTGTYWSGGSFYKQAVSVNDAYKISGWVYAGATTWRAIQNNKTLGSDYPIGYILTYLDSLNNVLGYETITSKIGDTGWVYLSKQVQITNSNIASFMIGTFIDGPYPLAASPANPICTEADTVYGCPGYAWYAGFRIENTNTPPSPAGLDSTGLYITGGMSVTTNFTSSVKLFEHNIRVKLNPTDFLYSVYNPSVDTKLQSSNVTPLELMSSQSLYPYITTIGLYNADNELLAVAKVSNPIQRTDYTTQTFVVKFDT